MGATPRPGSTKRRERRPPASAAAQRDCPAAYYKTRLSPGAGEKETNGAERPDQFHTRGTKAARRAASRHAPDRESQPQPDPRSLRTHTHAAGLSA